MKTDVTAEAAWAEFECDLEAGRAHTVRVCFPDHYGVLRGRRLTAGHFASSSRTPQAFCDGAMVWDIRCDIFEEADFSNYRTGYPDLYARPDPGTLRPCGWSPGEYAIMADACDAHGQPLAVDPRSLLRKVVDDSGLDRPITVAIELQVPDPGLKAALAPGASHEFVDTLAQGLAASGLPLGSVAWDRDRSLLTLTLQNGDPLAAADAAVLSRSAARELSKQMEVDLSAIPRLETDARPACLRISLESERGRGFEERLSDTGLLLRPLPLAYRGDEAPEVTIGDGRLEVGASSDANPYLAIAAVLMAATGPEAGTGAAAWTYAAVIDRFAASEWVAERLSPLFVHDAVALARRELGLREARITQWDLDRYRECG
ncbi:MAG: hypothetical protein J0H66_02140 [Solirubrobacterales bacterium]|nr:hypothetical protein [Solirubrobacterales bacterium]OJU95351.1 MAG: hypothetical protein BGO23_05735 [Solirubrobacterales bacterium 67-14]